MNGTYPSPSPNPVPPNRFSPQLSSEFFARGRSVEWLVQDVFPRLEPGVIGGPPKTFKTHVAVDLAISLATATPFLSGFTVPKARRVYFMSGETSRQALNQVFNSVMTARRLTMEHLNNLAWSTELPHLDKPDDVDQLTSMARYYGVDVLIVDPLYFCLSSTAGNATNLYAMDGLLLAFVRKCLAFEITPIFVHHAARITSKETRGVGHLSIRDLSCAGIAELARAWLLVNYASDYNTESLEHRLRMSLGGSAGYSSNWMLDVPKREAGLDMWRIRVSPPRTTTWRDHATKRDESIIRDGTYGII